MNHEDRVVLPEERRISIDAEAEAVHAKHLAIRKKTPDPDDSVLSQPQIEARREKRHWAMGR